MFRLLAASILYLIHRTFSVSLHLLRLHRFEPSPLRWEFNGDLVQGCFCQFFRPLEMVWTELDLESEPPRLVLRRARLRDLVRVFVNI